MGINESAELIARAAGCLTRENQTADLSRSHDCQTGGEVWLNLVESGHRIPIDWPDDVMDWAEQFFPKQP